MPEFVEIVKLIVVLFAVIVGYTFTGIANNCLVKNEKFDIIVLIKGLAKTLTACLSLIIVAYVCTIIDLSGLGFQPQTAITSGIVVYSAKLIRNAFGLLGLSKNGKDEEGISNILTNNNYENIINNMNNDPEDSMELFIGEEKPEQYDEDDFVDIDIEEDKVPEKENNNINAVG